MKIVKDRNITFLIVNEVKCVVQSYVEDDFANLSPIQNGRESIDDRLDNIRIDFINHHISTEGKENARWKAFVSTLNIAEIDKILKTNINNEVNQYAFELLKQQYDMPFLRIGMNAIVNKNAVKVTGVSSGQLKGKLINYAKEIHFHPTRETAYFTERWEIIKDYRMK